MTGSRAKPAPTAPRANAPKTADAPRAADAGPPVEAPAPAGAPVAAERGADGRRRPGTLRAGLIGLGAMGRNHARILSSLEGVEFVGAVDPAGDPHGSLRGLLGAHGVPVLPEVADLLALGVDYAVVACPTGLHEEVGLQLAAHGVCALIEKPLAHTAQAAHRLVRAFEERGLVAGVGHVERFNPALQQLRSRLEAGELGEVFQVVTRRQGPFPHRIADVGVVKDLATHDIDLTSWITGAAYASLSARTVSKSGREHEDMVAVVGSLVDGTMVSHLVNWLSPLKERFTAVTGERGCFVADTLTADLTFHANGAVATEWEALRAFRGVAEGDTVRFAFPKREPLAVEHERFRDAVRAGQAAEGCGIVTIREGLRTVEVSAAVLESARGTSDLAVPHGAADPSGAGGPDAGTGAGGAGREAAAPAFLAPEGDPSPAGRGASAHRSAHVAEHTA
ncbi:Gfo/Idh/MocA family oxidoreductase [Streptomyces diacarni]|uniref:Gfo/Idh/MocA family oxidoreductase n=2 Tax=Streptomyces diacarni TaxID=2800381 RepID=A0A367EDU4_9ACTN|nr:Gfo/Idh/MocA family oxidoreductase [Streptomyces diacarni]RCG16231.1 gfo/Idh/MocA family oxidoreductase [Streptomyces diacarni]